MVDRLDGVLSDAECVLDVAPTSHVRDFLIGRVGPKRYVGLDLGLDRRRIDVKSDLTRLPIRSGSIDLMIVFHVLEHIPEDGTAMSEIKRVIGDTGVALIHVPWRPDRPTDEDPSADPEERLLRFGQCDHVRMYGEDFEPRLRKAGLGVSRWEASRYLDPDTVRRLNIFHHVWLATGMASDPTETDAQIEAVMTRRRARSVKAQLATWDVNVTIQNELARERSARLALDERLSRVERRVADLTPIRSWHRGLTWHRKLTGSLQRKRRLRKRFRAATRID